MESTKNKNPKSDVGVLFLHGIGTQSEGQTLVDYGEPMIEAIKEWVQLEAVDSKAGDKGRVTLQAAHLLKKSGDTPAHVALMIDSTQGEKNAERWILAESYWADAYSPPNVNTVTLWLIKVTPAIWAMFFARRINMARLTMATTGKKVMRVLTPLALGIILLLTSPLLVLLEALLVLLIPLGLIPLSFIENIISQIQKVISSIIGDSFIFSSTSIRRQAILSKVYGDLEWVTAHCNKLIIVAHSQGAAVAYQTLKKFNKRKVNLLVTVGSGLKKLQILEPQNTAKKSLILLSSLPALLGAVFVTLSILYWMEIIPISWAGSLGWWVLPYSIVFGTFLLFISMLMLSRHRQSDEDISTFASDLKRCGGHWIDFYAKWDPVPNGPILLNDEERLIESHEITNSNSFFADHTGYRFNTEEFYFGVLKAVGSAKISSNITTHLSELTLQWTDALAEYRRQRISYLSTDRILLFAALLVLAVSKDSLQEFGETLARQTSVFSQLIPQVKDAAPLHLSYLVILVIWLLLYRVVSLFYSAVGKGARSAIMRKESIAGKNILLELTQRAEQQYVGTYLSLTAFVTALYIYHPFTIGWIEKLYEFTKQPSEASYSFQIVILSGIFMVLVIIIRHMRIIRSTKTFKGLRKSK